MEKKKWQIWNYQPVLLFFILNRTTNIASFFVFSLPLTPLGGGGVDAFQPPEVLSKKKLRQRERVCVIEPG